MGEPSLGKSDPRTGDADALFASGRFAEAETAYAAILAADPAQRHAIRRLGELALLGNRLDGAEQHLQRVVELAPDDREAAELLAESYFRRDNFAAAAALLQAHGLPAQRAAGFGDERPYAGLPSTDPVRLDFLVTDPLPLVALRLNSGVESAFLIDTGGPELIVDTEAAREIGLEAEAESTGTFAAGMTASVLHGKLDALALGSLELRDVPVTISPIRRFSHLFDRTVDGVLGTVVFYHFLAEMDYPGGRLTLWPKTPESAEPFEREVADGTRIAVPFWLAGDHLIVAPGQVNDGPPTLLFVDTGLAGGGFTCPQSTVEEAHVRLIHEAATEAAFPGGTVSITPLVVERLRLGEAEERDVQGLFGPFPPLLEHTHGFRIGGLISHTFFKPYDVVFDFTGMRLLLKRRDDHLPNPEARQ
jgi:hypothetical protein